MSAIAKDGEEALVMASSGNYDLMLLDLKLPGKDGLDVLMELRSQCEDMPVIIVSACTDEKDVATALESGANDYLKKPFRFRELLERIQLQLDNIG